MKIETPQILWHASEDGKSTPILSLSILQEKQHKKTAADQQTKQQQAQQVLATSGKEVNLWKIGISSSSSKENRTNIEHMVSLTRHQCSINTLSFSPDGLILAMAGDSGSIILYALSPDTVTSSITKSSTDNTSSSSLISTKDCWLQNVSKESDLSYKIIKSNHNVDLMDLQWDKGSLYRRFIVGSMDSEVLIYEAYYDTKDSKDTNRDSLSLATRNMEFKCSNSHHEILKHHSNDFMNHLKWKCVWRKKDHTSYVQGVCWDPLGVYVASQGSDRTVQLYKQKPQLKFQNHDNNNSNKKKSQITTTKINDTEDLKDLTPSSFSFEKLNLLKITTIKDIQMNMDMTATNNTKEEERTIKEQELNQPQESKRTTKKHRLFADESTVPSFFRRLSWTHDGAFLITPSALWYDFENNNNTDDNKKEDNTQTAAEDGNTLPQSQQLESPSFATYMFARHHYDRPALVLYGLEKPSVVVRPNPIKYKLPLTLDENNIHSHSHSLPYRSIFAVLSLDTIFIYDTYHVGNPLAMAHGLHFAGLTDCQWTDDGRHLIVSSSDGYISILSFKEGELGEIYNMSEEEEGEKKQENLDQEHKYIEDDTVDNVKDSMITTGKMLLQRTTTSDPSPSSHASNTMESKKRKVEENNNVGNADITTTNAVTVITKNSIDNDGTEKKKKKRIQPILLTK